MGDLICVLLNKRPNPKKALYYTISAIGYSGKSKNYKDSKEFNTWPEHEKERVKKK